MQLLNQLCFYKAGLEEVITNQTNINVELTFDDDGNKDGICINSLFFFHFYSIFQRVESNTRSLSDEEEPINNFTVLNWLNVFNIISCHTK